MLENASSVNLIIKVLGTTCNFSCDYCFEHLKSFSCRSHKVVSVEDIVRAIHDISVPVNVVFHGGEPLLAQPSYFRQVLSSLRTQMDRVKAIQIQTNGSLLSQEFVDLFWHDFQDLNIEISVSLDGNFSLNKLRTSHSKSTFPVVQKAIELLNKNGIAVGLLSVIHQDSLGQPYAYLDFLASIKNLRFVKLNPLHLLNGKELHKHSITPSEFSTFIINVFKLYIERALYTRFPIEPCLAALQVCAGENSKYCNFNMRKCQNFVCLYPDDQMTLCDSLPNTHFSIIDFKQRHLPLANFDYLLEECRKCSYQAFCRYGCLGIRYLLSANNVLSADYCASRKMLYHFFAKFV